MFCFAKFVIKKNMKPNFLSFSPFGCVAAGQLFAAVCGRFEHYFWYKLIPVAMVSKVFRHLNLCHYSCTRRFIRKRVELSPTRFLFKKITPSGHARGKHKQQKHGPTFLLCFKMLKDVEMIWMGHYGQSIIKRLLQMKTNHNTPLLHNVVYSC